MTRQDILKCVHEPFGDAFYFGPERLSARYEEDVRAREESGFAEVTFKDVFDRIEKDGQEGKRLFIKDIAHYLVPPERAPASIAPSLGGQALEQNDTNTNGSINGHKFPFPYNTIPEHGNPTVVPFSLLKQFHFTFLIRHPRHSIPSYYRCTVPPLDKPTGFSNFLPSEAGYDELRRIFDFLHLKNEIGDTPSGDAVAITVIDADDLLDNPAGIIKAYCERVGVDYRPDMLVWDSEEDYAHATKAFEKWKGFHEDAIESKGLRPRSAEHGKKAKTEEMENAAWTEKYGEKGQKIIRATVDANVPAYEYLKKFALEV